MSLPLALLEQRPIIVAIAGSNGAGKSTFFETFLAQTGLRFINADILGEGLQITTYEAAEVASAIRTTLVNQWSRSTSTEIESTICRMIANQIDEDPAKCDKNAVAVLPTCHILECQTSSAAK